MNTFNRVFLAVKKACEKQTKISGKDCFTTVANEANVPSEHIDSYLKYLQDAGLIRYSTEDSYILLTTFGSRQAMLIKE